MSSIRTIVARRARASRKVGPSTLTVKLRHSVKNTLSCFRNSISRFEIDLIEKKNNDGKKRREKTLRLHRNSEMFNLKTVVNKF